MGPYGAHHASGNTLALELPVVASRAQVSSSSAINARASLLSAGRREMPGQSGGARRVRRRKRIQRWLDRPRPSTGPCGARGASWGYGVEVPRWQVRSPRLNPWCLEQNPAVAGSPLGLSTGPYGAHGTSGG